MPLPNSVDAQVKGNLVASHNRRLAGLFLGGAALGRARRAWRLSPFLLGMVARVEGMAWSAAFTGRLSCMLWLKLKVYDHECAQWGQLEPSSPSCTGLDASYCTVPHEAPNSMGQDLHGGFVFLGLTRDFVSASGTSVLSCTQACCIHLTPSL